jgi:hypothetical protein
LSSVIVLPVSGSIGSSPVSFALRFGFDAIFAAIGFSVVDPEVVVPVDMEDVDRACVDADLDPDVVTPDAVAAGLPEVDFASFALEGGLPDGDFVGLTVVVGLLLVRVVVDVARLPLIVGLVLIVGLPLTVGLPLVVGFPMLAGLPGLCGLLGGPPLANTGVSASDVAATTLRIVAESRSRIRVPPGGEGQA